MMNKKVIAVALALVLAGGGYAQNDASGKKVKAYMVSDAHLDTQWNWDIQTTINEYVWNTISQNLFLLKKYPEYIFNFEGGVKYAWMKEYYPLDYEKVKEAIKNGRWHVSGSSWDANDVNVPSPESSFRNILLGQEFYKKEMPMIEKIATDEESELIRNIIKTRKDLEFANNNYEFADSDLIDYYIYEIKANQAKLNYLIKMAKIKGLSVHFIKELEYRLSTDEENAI